jgi:hypothetical protein
MSPFAYIIPIDINMVGLVTTCTGAAAMGAAVGMGKMWITVQRLDGDMSAIKAQAAAQQTELRTVAESLVGIKSDLSWIKQKLEEKH